MGDNTDPTRAFGWSLGEGARRQKGGIKRFGGWDMGATEMGILSTRRAYVSTRIRKFPVLPKTGIARFRTGTTSRVTTEKKFLATF